MNGLRSRLACAAIVLTALLIWVEAALAQTNAAPQILFLHLRLTQKDIALVESSVRPGVAKPQPNAETKEIQFELVSSRDKVLWRGAMDDPRVRHVEFENPPRSGHLKRKIIQSKEAEATIRVPLLAEARQIDFYALDSAEVGKSDKPPARKLLGTVALLADGKPAP
jgi:hypothetical protein